MPEAIFHQTMRRYGADEQTATRLWQALAEAYGSAGRHYHNGAHLEHMLGQLEAVKDLVADWDALVCALYYHDIVYEPLAKDNEARSADQAAAALSRCGAEAGAIAAVKAMILATQSHASEGDGDTGLLLDADLSMLGADPRQYDAYADAIRREYSLVPDEQYIPGRGQVLLHFLDRAQIYKTAHFRALYEVQARANLKRELAALAVQAPAQSDPAKTRPSSSI